MVATPQIPALPGMTPLGVKPNKTNKEKYADTYTQAFIDSYPELPAEKTGHLIKKALEVALKNIRSVNIDGRAFKLTSKRLGIKHTFTAIEEFLAA